MMQIADMSENQYIEFLDDFYINNKPDKDFYKLYIHYPFCKNICKYCIYSGYPFNGNGMTIGLYEDRVIQILNKIDSFLNKHSIKLSSISFGGGTPSLWSREKIREMTNLDFYKNARFIETEAHHEDLVDGRIEFMVNQMNIDRISIGVQTFDTNFIKLQNREECDVNILSSIVSKFRSNGVIVNLDFIAFIDDDNDLSMLKNDINNAIDINPDTIIITPNFKSNNFFNNVKKLRLFLSEYLKHNERFCISKRSLSLDDDDIKSFGDGGYTLINKLLVPDGIECEHISYKSLKYFSNPDDNVDSNVVLYNEIVNLISIGGINKRISISKTSGPKPLLLGCKYIPNDDRFIFGITDVSCDYNITDSVLSGESVTIGNQTINIK